jgi:A/G-specific adenine glycosylase
VNESFAQRLIDWHARHGRHDLPWQTDWRTLGDPYRVWLSEIMLQQTQVATVIPYYQRFLARFPDLPALAGAPLQDVLALWSGLGYYARARNLHACALRLMHDHAGQFPHDPQLIARLPGIGRSTANAIATFCFGAHTPILDGNVKRVLCRHFGVAGFPGATAVERSLWELADELMPRQNIASYIQAQMDLGATLCTRSRPACARCPLADSCVAHRDDRCAELPHKRPGRTVPLRETLLLVCRCEDAIWLEQRPPAGIWGGLHSLPELPACADASAPEVTQAIAARLQTQGLCATSCTALPAFVHVFSHFRLRATPWLCDVRPNGTTAATSGSSYWLAAAQMQSAPLPAPIRSLLERVFSGSL